MRYLILAIALLVLVPLAAPAADVLILQARPSRVMDQISRLVQNDCVSGNRTLVLSDYAEIDLSRMVREEQAKVVVAIGDRALAEAKELRQVPVVYGMALNTMEKSLGDNVSGVTMTVSPDCYLKLFLALKLRRIGVIYDQNKTGAYLNRARAAGKRAGIELVHLQIHSPKEVPQKLAGLGKRQLDALWLVPDTTAITPETVDSYFTFAQQQGLPVIGFSPAYLTKGALASLELTPQELGTQLCNKIRASRSGSNTGSTDSPRGKLLFNESVAEKLGIRIPPASVLPTTLSTDG